MKCMHVTLCKVCLCVCGSVFATGCACIYAWSVCVSGCAEGIACMYRCASFVFGCARSMKCQYDRICTVSVGLLWVLLSNRANRRLVGFVGVVCRLWACGDVSVWAVALASAMRLLSARSTFDTVWFRSGTVSGVCLPWAMCTGKFLQMTRKGLACTFIVRRLYK